MSVLGSIMSIIFSVYIMYVYIIFNVYMEAMMKQVKMGMERRGVRFQEEE